MGLFSLEKRRLKGNLTNAYKHLLGRSQVDRTRLFSVVPSEKIRGNEAQTRSQGVPYKHEEKLFYFEGDRALRQSAERGFTISFPGDIQNSSDHLSV